jgi:hypothetical protein
MGFSQPRKKYGNKKIEVDGVKFDSKLEMKCYNLLKEMEFSFEFQKKITLVDKFRYNKEAIRAITIVVDFVLDHDGKIIYIDTKGFATEVSKIKYKMLRYMLKDEENTDVVWLHTQKEVSEYLIKLKEER